MSTLSGYPVGMELLGINGQVLFDGSMVTIKREGLKARMGHGSAERVFPVSQVQQVVFHKPGFATNGNVVFKLIGEPAKSVPDVSHENSVLFKKSSMVDAEALVNAVRAAQV